MKKRREKRTKMEWKKISVIAIFFGLLMAMSMLPVSAIPNFPTDHGPRTSEMGVYYYTDDTSCYSALKTGAIDFMAWPLTRTQVEDAKTDPDIVLGEQVEMGMMEFDINNNYTLSACRADHRNPCNDLHFRKAIAHCVDKDYIVDEILEGYASRMDVPLPKPQSAWWNPEVTGENYPYPFSLASAEAELDAGGFTDPDENGIRNYPEGWFGKSHDDDLDPILFYIRQDDPERTAAGQHLAANLEAVNVPVDEKIVAREVCYDAVMSQKCYHIYTGGWGLGRFPTTLFFLYHSRFWTPVGTTGYNYVTGMNSTNQPNYPDLDDALADIYYADVIDVNDLIPVVYNAEEIFVNYAVMIPLWSAVTYQGWRSWCAGMVNEDSYGPENSYTFMNVYEADVPGNDHPNEFRMGIAQIPGMLNPVYNEWFYEYQSTDRVFDNGRNVQPYNIYADQPWIFQDWNFSTWDGGSKSKLTIWLRKDISFVNSIDGTWLYNATTDDFLFSVWFVNAFDDGWNWDTTMDVDYVNVIDDYCVEIYFTSKSYWFFYAGYTPYLFPKQVYEMEPLCVHHVSESYTVGSAKLPTTPGPINTTDGTDLFKPVQIESINASAYIKQGNATGGMGQMGRPWIYIDESLTPGTVVTVDYWAAGDSSGTYMGGLTWAETLIGCGQYYVTDVKKEAGGWFKCKANDYYFMETPLLGEIDWVWYWGPRDNTRPAPDEPNGPRTGNFKIDLYDATMVNVPYGAQGKGGPEYGNEMSENWFPGADVSPAGGKIDLYDAVTVSGPHYGLTFGEPPLDP